jgi:hypothetical protein
MPSKLKDWILDVRGKRPPEEVYVESTEVPEEPAGPYRARMEKAAQERVVQGIDVSEREVVTGELETLYAIRCPCGHRWPSPQPQRVNLCPKCDRAVLVEVPTPPTG